MAVCGDYGGTTQDGTPCQRKVNGSPCPDHSEELFAEIRHPKKRAFLQAFVLTASKTRAAEAAGIHRTTQYTDQWLDDDEFQAALRKAQNMAIDHLEAEAVRRATEGVKKPVGFYKGEPSAFVREYSDTLLIVLLKANAPERYRERTEITGPDGGPLEIKRVETEIDDFVQRIREMASRN